MGATGHDAVGHAACVGAGEGGGLHEQEKEEQDEIVRTSPLFDGRQARNIPLVEGWQAGKSILRGVSGYGKMLRWVLHLEYRRSGEYDVLGLTPQEWGQQGTMRWATRVHRRGRSDELGGSCRKRKRRRRSIKVYSHSCSLPPGSLQSVRVCACVCLSVRLSRL